MKLFLITILFFGTFVSTASAYDSVISEQPSPFDIQSLETIADQQQLVGELEGFPHTFQFLLKNPATLRAQLMILDQEDQAEVSFIAVKEVERGVTEVTRIQQKTTTWSEYRDPKSGIDFLESEQFEAELEPGIYRMEVSNPVNEGNYVLRIGTEEVSAGYFETISDITTLRRELGLNPLGAIFNSRILIPTFALGSLLFFGWFFWRLKRNKFTEPA